MQGKRGLTPLAHMKQRVKEFWINAVHFECLTFGQDADGIMAVQAFLMAGDDTKITNPPPCMKLFAKKPRRIFDKDWIGGIQLGKGLFVFPFDHHLRFGRHSAAARFDQILKPQAILITVHLGRDTGHGPL